MNELPDGPECDLSAGLDDGPDADEGSAEVLDDISEAQAHCPHCLEPVAPDVYYCPKCNRAISGLVCNLPYESIPSQVNFFGDTWRKMLAQETLLHLRVVCALVIILLAPIMLLGVPLIVWHKVFPRRPRPHGA